MRWFVGVLGVGLIGAIVVVIVIGVRMLVSPPADATDVVPRQLAQADGSLGATPLAPPPNVPAPENVDAQDRDLENPDAVLREIRAAIDDLPVRPTRARSRFDRAVSAAGRFWPRYGPDRLAAVRGAVVDFVYAAAVSSSESATSAVRSLAKPIVDPPSPGDSDAIAPAAWATGMLTALRRERELPESMIRTIDRAILSGFGTAASNAATFEGGTGAALRALGDELARASVEDDAWLAAWTAWVECVDAVGRGDRALLAALQTHGLGALLATGPSPSARPAADRVIDLLATRVAWRADDGSRSWLLDELVSVDADGPALASLTRAIAERSGAEGVDPSMTLAGNATMLRRRELRDEYASRWGLFSATMSEGVVGDWVSATRVWLDSEQDPAWLSSVASGDLRAGARAVVLARLNAAASAAWRGDERAAFDILDSLDTGVTALLGAYDADGSGWDDGPAFDERGDWAQRYLLAERNVARRMDLIDERSRGGRLGAVDAEVLMREALLGQPERVRIAAGELVVSLAGAQPAVVNAAIELLPSAPRSRRVAEMLADLSLTSLPEPRDPAFRTAARRALVERLLELVASSGPLGVVEGFGLLIGEAYNAGVGTQGAQARPEEAARVLADRRAGLAARALPFTDPRLSARTIQSRRAARLRIARGPMQLFAAEQVTLVEVTASVVRSERPTAESRITALLDRLTERRRNATHVLQQIAAAEEALTELWALRFGADL
ncbi:MAG: hypothetical protein AAF297_06280 [Planctomycetota bacterium]